MKKILTAFFFFILTFTLLAAGARAEEAEADIRNAQGRKVGEATLTDSPEGVAISLKVWSLEPGKHGIHIHAAAKCDAPDFKSAGGHFNPAGKKHGHKNPEGAHAGDLSNLEVDADGNGAANFTAANVKIKDGDAALLSASGTSLVIHAKEDDETTDPSGNSGERIACGAIIKPGF